MVVHTHEDVYDHSRHHQYKHRYIVFIDVKAINV
jgi:hypothetical protein